MKDQKTTFEGYSYRTSARFGSRVQVSVEDGTASVTGPRVGVLAYRLWIGTQVVLFWLIVPVLIAAVLRDWRYVFLALALLWRSQADLGRSWMGALAIKEEHALVTQGVYRHIRHPMYAAQWLWGIAQALLLQNWIGGLGMLAAFMPLYLYRVPREEQMMLELFGDSSPTPFVVGTIPKM
jgi:protein-S-isoprenylcysteine O-methyltransferase Ste14